MAGRAEETLEFDEEGQWRTAGDRIQVLLDASAAGGAVARERAEQLVREIVDLYGAGPRPADPDGRRRRSRAGRSVRLR